MTEMHAGHIELAVARHLEYRANLIVPNINQSLWGGRELDLVILHPNGYVDEIEIKITVQDFKRDSKKAVPHGGPRIRRWFYAIPRPLKSQITPLLPADAGLFVVWFDPKYKWLVRCVKAATVNKNARRLTTEEITKLYHLAAMRLWSLKEHNYRLQEEIARLRAEADKP